MKTKWLDVVFVAILNDLLLYAVDDAIVVLKLTAVVNVWVGLISRLQSLLRQQVTFSVKLTPGIV